MDNIGWRYYIVFCVLLAVIVVNTYFFYPETKGYSLEEVAMLFDGEKVTDLEAVISHKHQDESELLLADKKADVDHIEEVATRENL